MTMKLGLSTTDTNSLELTLGPGYDYRIEPIVDKNDVRTKTSALFSKQLYTYVKIIIPETAVGSSNRTIINSWWTMATDLKFLENDTYVNSVYTVRIMGSSEPYPQFRRPYLNVLHRGQLVLETIEAV